MIHLKRTATLLGAILLGFSMAGCGDQPQELQGQAIKNDNAPYSGVGKSQYADKGWQAGDRTSWEQHLKARAQYGQNDYARMSN